MTLEQLLVITKLLNQVDPVSMWEDEDSNCWTLDLGTGKEIEIWADGTQSWWLNGKQHREDGPAVMYANGFQRWYQNDKWLSETEHTAAVAKLLRQETK